MILNFLFSPSHDHSSILSIIFPVINFAFFCLGIFYFAKNKVINHYQLKSKNLSLAYYSKIEFEKKVCHDLSEAKLQFEKIGQLREHIQLQSQQEFDFYQGKLRIDLAQQWDNRKHEVEKMIASEQKILYLDFYQNFLEEIFKEAKEEVVNNNLQQQKISINLLNQLVS